MRRLAVGIAGFGSAGRRHHRNLRLVAPGADVMAYDPALGPVRRLGLAVRGVRTAPDAGALWARGLDALVIASPADTHAAWLAEACRHDVAVLCEKPVVSAGHLAAAHEVARRIGRPAFVGYNWLWHDGVQAMRFETPRPREVTVRVMTDMSAWPGRSYGDPLLECSHELAVMADWFGPLRLRDAGDCWMKGVSPSADWTFVLHHDVADRSEHARTWMVRGARGQARRYEFRPHGERFDRSYQTMLAEFLREVEGGRSPRGAGWVHLALDVVELCAEAGRIGRCR